MDSRGHATSSGARPLDREEVQFWRELVQELGPLERAQGGVLESLQPELLARAPLDGSSSRPVARCSLHLRLPYAGPDMPGSGAATAPSSNTKGGVQVILGVTSAVPLALQVPNITAPRLPPIAGRPGLRASIHAFQAHVQQHALLLRTMDALEGGPSGARVLERPAPHIRRLGLPPTRRWGRAASCVLTLHAQEPWHFPALVFLGPMRAELQAWVDAYRSTRGAWTGRPGESAGPALQALFAALLAEAPSTAAPVQAPAVPIVLSDDGEEEDEYFSAGAGDVALDPAPESVNGNPVDTTDFHCQICFLYLLAGEHPTVQCGGTPAGTSTTNGLPAPAASSACGKAFHPACIQEWLQSLPTCRRFFHTLLGPCPYCGCEVAVEEGQGSGAGPRRA